jgi:hypothetical protein
MKIYNCKNMLFPDYELNNGDYNLSCNPFFIIGSGRSGNTLLRGILVSHPKISIPPESYVLKTVIWKFQTYTFLPWNDIIKIVIGEFESSNDFFAWDIKMYPVYENLKKLRRKERTLAKIIDEIYCHYGRNKFPDFEIWGDKTPINTLHLDSIYPIFKNANYIHLIRDGRDVVSSLLKMGRFKTVEEAALRWKKSIKYARRFGKQKMKNYIEIRYEDLVSNPKFEVEKICNFLNINFDENMLNHKERAELKDVKTHKHYSNVKKPINTRSIGKYKRNLSELQKNKVEKIIQDDLIKLNYI